MRVENTVIQADLITSYIKAKSVEHNVPVISFIEDTATSCGYWLACAGTEIYACRNSLGKSCRFHQSVNETSPTSLINMFWHTKVHGPQLPV